MLTSYLKLSLRLLARNPFFTFINVAGLSVGFAVFFILWQYSENELKSDQQWKDWERIVRFGFIGSWTDDKINWQDSKAGNNSPGLTYQFAREYGNITGFTRIFFQHNFNSDYITDHGKNIFLAYEDENHERISFKETKVVYADPNLFDFFSLPLIKGNSATSLVLPNSVALSDRYAKKYFGEIDPIGKIILLNGNIPFKVTGVFANLPCNTHLDFEVVISTEKIKETFNRMDGSGWWGPDCYFKIEEGADIGALEARMNNLSKDLIKKGIWERTAGRDSPAVKAEVYLEPLEEVPFVSYRQDNYKPKSKDFLHLLNVVSIIVLLIAWINYVNLTVSSNNNRFRELAVRKVQGAKPLDFIFQFVIESFIINALAFLLAITLVQLVRYPAETLLQFYIPRWKDISSLSVILLVSLLLGGALLTGIYPAVVTMKQSPGNLFGSSKYKAKSMMSNYLTSFQFVSAIVFLVWIYTANGQLHYILEKDIGLSKDQVIILDLPVVRSDNFKNDLNFLVQELKELTAVQEYSLSTSVAGDNVQDYLGISDPSTGNHIAVEINGGVDENYIPFYRVKLLAGRNFMKDNPFDENAVIISKGAARRLNIQNLEDAIGRRILAKNQNQSKAYKESQIIGVFDDYKLRPLLKAGYNTNYDGTPGLALTYKDFLAREWPFNKISLRINASNFPGTMEEIHKKYARVFPGAVYYWYFLDDHINRQYQNDKIARNQIMFFTFLTISIACLGLLGMISNKVVEKTKEIGIRKVLGAELYQIAQILLNATFRQITIATIIGIPVAYYLTQQYLQKFSERIELQWWHFALPVMMLVLIMLGTVATVVWKAAKSNPVEALKYE